MTTIAPPRTLNSRGYRSTTSRFLLIASMSKKYIYSTYKGCHKSHIIFYFPVLPIPMKWGGVGTQCRGRGARESERDIINIFFSHQMLTLSFSLMNSFLYPKLTLIYLLFQAVRYLSKVPLISKQVNTEAYVRRIPESCLFSFSAIFVLLPPHGMQPAYCFFG